MMPRQTIGLRKTNTGIRKRGRERREKLIRAAYELLCERSIEEVAFIDIARRAGVPEGSAYHFFANRYDVFSALARELGSLFIDAHKKSIAKKNRCTWQALAAHIVDVGARVYRENPPARQLLIGSKTPPEVKQADRVHDRAVATQLAQQFRRYFHLHDEKQAEDALFYFIEITDLLFSLSLVEYGEITNRMITEAKRAGCGYLHTYFGDSLEPRD